ncbi:MAG: flippase-like domain-containing protein [Clostridia bacterium]|nr:flippase-like domain-containing protein [Clostridia bacterium]
MIKKKYKGKIHHLRKGNSYNMEVFYATCNKKVIKKQPKTKKNVWSLVFFLVNIFVIAIVLAVQLNSEEGISSIKDVFNSNIQYKFILIALLCFLTSNIISSFKLDFYHKKLQKRYRPLLCFKTQMMGKYYTKLTPFGIGGQPFQVYYFSKYGVKASNSLTMVSCSYVSNKLMYGLLALVMMATFRFNKLLMSQGSLVNIVIVLAFISFMFLALYLTFVILMCLNKKLGHRIVAFVVKVLTKLRIVKNPVAFYLKIMRPTLVFQRKMQKFFSSKGITCEFLVLSLLEYIIEYSVLFFVYSAFNGFDISVYLQLLSISVIIELACHSIPLPGGSGLAELSFSTIFASLFDSGVLFWALIIWRLITYYTYLFSGMGIIVYDYAYGKRKLKRYKNYTVKNKN